MTIQEMRAEIRVLRYALAMATGHEPVPQELTAKWEDGTLQMEEYIAAAQDELRHGRGPELYRTECPNNANSGKHCPNYGPSHSCCYCGAREEN